MDFIQRLLSDADFPLGFRFHPTDVELLLYYLLPKLKGEDLSSSEFIMDFLGVYQHDPDRLPLDQFKHGREKEAYFFTLEEIKNSVGEGPVRTTPTGYWKAYREDVPIHHNQEIIGFKNKLLFYRENVPNGTQTDWKMTEYFCSPSWIATTSTSTVGRYVVCKVRQKMRAEEDEPLLEEENGFIEGSK
ncbi:NAC transcription factor 29-like [Sesamum indicum]|uniref:NAC transcription factor 29-like n=1 Tax=Sesamum indicum TaxID=4182 RepID=A0A6I9SY28_SESIN|nr:NAC transcription factor 29-like [Sesamum indicum]